MKISLSYKLVLVLEAVICLALASVPMIIIGPTVATVALLLTAVVIVTVGLFACLLRKLDGRGTPTYSESRQEDWAPTVRD